MLTGLGGTILTAIAKAFFQTFADSLQTMFNTWRLETEAAGRGRAEAERDQAAEGQAAQADMGKAAAQAGDYDDLLKRLDGGEQD